MGCSIFKESKEKGGYYQLTNEMQLNEREFQFKQVVISFLYFQVMLIFLKNGSATVQFLFIFQPLKYKGEASNMAKFFAQN